MNTQIQVLVPSNRRAAQLVTSRMDIDLLVENQDLVNVNGFERLYRGESQTDWRGKCYLFSRRVKDLRAIEVISVSEKDLQLSGDGFRASRSSQTYYPYCTPSSQMKTEDALLKGVGQ